MTALVVAADRLNDFDHDARLLDLETFRALHGDAFFVHYGAFSTMTPDAAMRGTLSSECLRIDGSWLYQYFVFRLRKAPGERRDMPVTVGRTSENDVVVPHGSLSRRHALVAPTGSSEGSPWIISDLGSTNGTFVDDLPVTGEEEITLVTGSRVRLGTVELIFLLASEFCTLVRCLTPRGL